MMKGLWGFISTVVTIAGITGLVYAYFYDRAEFRKLLTAAIAFFVGLGINAGIVFFAFNVGNHIASTLGLAVVFFFVIKKRNQNVVYQSIFAWNLIFLLISVIWSATCLIFYS